MKIEIIDDWFHRRLAKFQNVSSLMMFMRQKPTKWIMKSIESNVYIYVKLHFQLKLEEEYGQRIQALYWLSKYYIDY